jgi:hypothetical protein
LAAELELRAIPAASMWHEAGCGWLNLAFHRRASRAQKFITFFRQIKGTIAGNTISISFLVWKCGGAAAIEELLELHPQVKADRLPYREQSNSQEIIREAES